MATEVKCMPKKVYLAFTLQAKASIRDLHNPIGLKLFMEVFGAIHTG